MTSIEEWVDKALSLSKENANLKAALKEMLEKDRMEFDEDSGKMVEHPIDTMFLLKHQLKVKEFLP